MFLWDIKIKENVKGMRERSSVFFVCVLCDVTELSQVKAGHGARNKVSVGLTGPPSVLLCVKYHR